MALDSALALNHKLADITPPLLPSGLLLVLIDPMPEDHLPTVLAALRAAAARLHEEDDLPTMHATRFFGESREGRGPAEAQREVA